MIVSDATIKTLTVWATVLGLILSAFGILTAVLTFLGRLQEFRDSFLKPAWNRTLKPFLKIVIASASLIIPNCFIIGFLMYGVATYYLEAGSIDFLITNPRVFIQLVAWQAGLVSLYSFLWTFILYPRIRSWFILGRTKDPATINSQKLRTPKN